MVEEESRILLTTASSSGSTLYSENSWIWAIVSTMRSSALRAAWAPRAHPRSSPLWAVLCFVLRWMQAGFAFWASIGLPRIQPHWKHKLEEGSSVCVFLLFLTYFVLWSSLLTAAFVCFLFFFPPVSVWLSPSGVCLATSFYCSTPSPYASVDSTDTSHRLRGQGAGKQ